MFFTIFCFVYFKKMFVDFMSNRVRVICGKHMLSPSVHLQCLTHTQSQPLTPCCLLLSLFLLFIYLEIDCCRQAGQQAKEHQEQCLPSSLAVPAPSVSTCCLQPLLVHSRAHCSRANSLFTLSLVVSGEFLTAKLSDDLTIFLTNQQN